MSDVIRVFLPTDAADASPRPIAEIDRDKAHRIVADVIQELQADAIAQVRWADVLANRILRNPTEDRVALAHTLLALAAIDTRPLGRVTLDSMRYLYARIEPEMGILDVAAVDSPEERAEARHRLFLTPHERLAA
jgi:hypothetical protein